MDRKYLDRKGNNSKNTTDSDTRKFELKKNQQTEKDSFLNQTEDIKNDIIDTNQYSHSLTTHIGGQGTKIERIKKMQSNFDRELDLLRFDGEMVIHENPTKKTEFESIGEEFASGKIIKNITSIIEKQGEERIQLLKNQLEDEKKNSEELKIKLHENLQKISVIESSLKNDRNTIALELEEKTNKLISAERLAAIGELASRLAHDLKNPLSVIKGTVQIIKHTNKDNLDDLTHKRIELVEKSVFRMTHQIEDVLDYVRIMPLKINSASLSEILISTIQSLMIPSNVIIKLPEDDGIISCDRHKLEVVFSNLILNSIQSIGNEKGTITIRTTKNNTQLIIELEDSGQGIPVNILPKIFDPLFTTKQEGTGLGLSTCKNIIEQHKGTIGAVNNPTTFSIVLPM
jgi:two-component system sensor histidine kinase HydH